MKVSAFVFTSGLGQETEGLIECPLSDSIDMTWTSSSSRELFVLRFLARSPFGTKSISEVLNGGAGGAMGISGDGGTIMAVSF